MKSKLFLLFVIIILMSSSMCFAFSDNYVWSVLDNSIATSGQLVNGDGDFDNSFR